MHKDAFPTDRNLAQTGLIDEVTMTKPYEEYIAHVVDRENLLVVCPDGTTREIVEQEAAAREVVAQALLSHVKSHQELVIASDKKLVEYYKGWMSGRDAKIPATGTVTGDIPVKTRERRWSGMDTVCTTPEMFLQGIEKNVVCPKQFGLVVFVDGNMARGKHKLVEAARVLAYSASCNCNGNKCHSASNLCRSRCRPECQLQL